MRIVTGNEIEAGKWENFAGSNEFKTPFQTKAFFDLFNSVNGYTAKVFAVEEGNEIAALCVVTIQKEKGMKAFFSRRAIIFGGPLLTESKKAAEYLLRHISSELKQVIYIETRNFNDYSKYKNEFISSGWKYEAYLNFHLDCSSEEIAWKNLNSNRQRQIKKALKLGVVTEEAKTEKEVSEFYGILRSLYKTKVKKPLFSLEFFQKFISSGVGKILLVKLDDKIIGGIACPILKGNTIYELYICGLDHEYKDCSPSVMATYAAIEYGFKNGLKRFDFMGAGRSDEGYGVREFKEKFGGELVEHGRFIKINNPFLYNLGKTALSVLGSKKS